jgi:hypothetical protein
MLRSVEDIQSGRGLLEGNLYCTDRWFESPAPTGGTWQHLRVFLGDPSSGPGVWFFSASPTDRPESPGMADSLRHYHRSDSFRIALGAGEPEQYHLRGRWHEFGEYRLDPGNLFYADERFGFDGYTVAILFGDRRGMFPITESLRDVEDYSALAGLLGGFPWGDNLSEAFLRDEQSAKGLATTTRSSVPRAGLKGSFQDDADWTHLADGSAFSAWFMADGASGPVVLLSKNQPDVVEAPAGAYSTDMLRMVLKGSVTVGDRTYRAGEFLATEADIAQGEVRHGPEGSWQVLLLADRRGWLPTTVEDSSREVLPRLAEIGTVLSPFVSAAADAG